MTRPSSARWLALGAAVTVACGGTETDNPVVGSGGYESPERFAPAEPAPPGCIPLGLEELPGQLRALARSLWVETSAGSTLAIGDDYTGLGLYAPGAEAASPASTGAVRGSIHQIIAGADSELWVAASEPPSLSSGELPSAAELEVATKLSLLDVNDPSAPARLAEAALAGDFFQMWTRGEELWVLSGRRMPEQRGCRGEPHPCGWSYYEALELQGYRSSATGLEAIAHSEVPFELRAWFGGEGVVSVAPDGAWHVLYWDAAGTLRGPRVIAEAPSGPAEVKGTELWAYDGDGALSIFDLAAPGAPRAVALPGSAAAAGVSSLFWQGRLWLTPPEGSPASAELWQVDAAAPARIALPAAYTTLLPIAEATLDDRPNAALALGFFRDAKGLAHADLLAIEAASAARIESLPTSVDSLWPGNRLPAPPVLRGAGPDGSSYEIVVRGAGLPLGLDPAAPPGFGRRSRVRGFVTPTSVGSGEVEAALVESFADAGVQPNPRLEILRGGTRRSFELSPLASELVPTPRGVVVLAAGEPSQCEQTGRDCAGHAPGVVIFDLSAAPALIGEVALPPLPAPDPDQPFHVSATWSAHDAFSERDVAAWDLGGGRLAFVARVGLSCDDEAECLRLGLEPLPIGQAGVVTGSAVNCPPGSGNAGDCSATPPAPSVYGQGGRQYVFALDLDAAGGPRFIELGVSTLEASSAFQERDSRFGAVRELDGVLVATRLERYSSAGALLPVGQARFMMDRFALDDSGEAIALPPVNVPGQPVARLSAEPELERWFSVEPLPGETGAARLHRLRVNAGGASIEASLELDATFAGFAALQVADATYGVALAEPANACGSTTLQVVALGGRGAAGELTVASTLELPADGWRVVATEAAQVLLRRDRSYALLEVGPSGGIELLSVQSTDAHLESEQLSGSVLRGGGGRLGPVRLGF